MDYQRQEMNYHSAVILRDAGKCAVGMRLAIFALQCIEISQDNAKELFDSSIKAYKQKRQMSDEEFRLLTWKVYPDWLLEARHPVESDEEIVEENE